jgi:hypothetical protein
VQQPLFVVGKPGHTPSAVETEDLIADAVQEKPIMGDQDQGPGEFLQAVLQDIERRDIQVVGWFVKQQNIGGLSHQAGDQDTGLLAAGELTDRGFQLIGAKEEFFGPGDHMQGSPLVDDGIAIRCEGPSQGYFRIDLLSPLVKTDNTDGFGQPDCPGIGDRS